MAYAKLFRRLPLNCCHHKRLRLGLDFNGTSGTPAIDICYGSELDLNFPQNQSNQRVIEVIRSNREVSRRRISTEAGLSTPSVTRLVNELVDAGYLKVSDSTMGGGAGPGRPASIVSLNPTCGSVIGVDVGEHFIQAALSDMNVRVIKELRVPTDAEQGSDVTCSKIVHAIEEVMAFNSSAHTNSAPSLRAITIGVPGTIDPTSSKVVRAPMINGWSDFDLKSQLKDRLPKVPLRIENDINAAAVGEYAAGVAQDHGSFVFASMRGGIGAGIFIDGQLYRGNAGFAGELGKMVFDPNFQFSPATGMGNLESICGEATVAATASQKGIDLGAGKSGQPTIRSLSKAVAEGNTQAIEIFDSILDHFGLAIANIASLLDPRMIVVGGDIHEVMEISVKRLNEIINRLVPSPPVVVGSSLGDRAVLTGALQQAHRDACDRLLV